MSVQEIDDVELLRSFSDPWKVLARRAIEPNVFYEPWALIPALSCLRSRFEVRVVLIWSDEDPGRLLGLFPLIHNTHYRRLPLIRWSTWTHNHCYLGAPLVRGGEEEDCFKQFFRWLWDDNRATVFSINKLPTKSGLYRALTEFLRKEDIYVDDMEKIDRAILEPSLNHVEYLSAGVRPKKRKELRRQKHKLSELGRLEFSLFRHRDIEFLDRWIDEFLTLEKSGWKGKNKTALASTPAEKEFADQLLRGAAGRDQLLMHRMTLDGRPIAMKVSFTADQCGFAFKIAYDENYSRYSPGVLLEYESMKTALDQLNLRCFDSCADENHNMIDHLWRERRQIVNLHIATRRSISRPIMKIMKLGKATKDRLQPRKLTAG